jgi:dipeptidyl aminopeptidase/acylaminoacyl peptidase
VEKENLFVWRIYPLVSPDMAHKILAIGLAALCVSVRAADLIPIEDFARPPVFTRVQLAPDGKTCAFIREVDGVDALFFADVATAKVQGFDLGHAMGIDLGGGARELGQREVQWYRWLGPKRVLVGIGYWNLIEGTAAYDLDGTNWQAISGVVGQGPVIRLHYRPLHAYRALHSFNDDTHVLMLDQHGSLGDERLFPDVIDMNSQTGSYEQVAKNPGNVVAWTADRQGVVRIGLQRDKGKISLIYRDDGKSSWRPLPGFEQNPEASPMLLGFSSDGKSFYFAAYNEKHFRALYRSDLSTGTISDTLLEVPGYDVEFPYAGLLAGPIWSDQKQAIVGFRYVTDGPQVKWFDEEYAKNMAAINQALPGRVNLPVSIVNQDRSMLVLSFSDSHPGAYYIYSPENGKMQGFVRARPWIKAEQMAVMNPISYKARDGLEIHGYLTIPQGQAPHSLPLVVMPHAGLFVRDIWGYDPLVQMLANRGYAVLQMNYRGSAGYGQEFSKKGSYEVGGKIQDDIEDATRWAIEKKVADPKRIAIVGASYGGYSALYALGKSKGLYCCGISIAGVIDWVSLYKKLDNPEDRFAREYWAREIGDPAKDEEKLKAASPINFAEEIKAPLLIIQGKDDKIVTPKQAKGMITALEKAGQKPQSLFIADEGHGFRKEKSRLQEYKAIEAFLVKHLGPGATSAAPAPAVAEQQAAK